MRWFEQIAKALGLMAKLNAVYNVLQSVDAHTAPASAYQPAADVILGEPAVQEVLSKLSEEQQDLARVGLPIGLKLLDAFMEREK